MSQRRTNVWLGRVALGGLFLALSIAGCGDDDDGQPGDELGGNGGDGGRTPQPGAGRGGISGSGGASGRTTNEGGTRTTPEPGGAGNNPQSEGGSAGLTGSTGSGGSSESGTAGAESGGRTTLVSSGGSGGNAGSATTGGTTAAGGAGAGGTQTEGGSAGAGGDGFSGGSGGTTDVASAGSGGETGSGCPNALCSTEYSTENCGTDCSPILSESCLLCDAEKNCNAYLCSEALGVAVDGPAAGVARLALCSELLECLYRSRCWDHSGEDPFACYCGAATQEECESGNAQGPCREEYERAGETVLYGLLEARLGMEEHSPLTLAANRVTCDSQQCRSECFPDPG